MAFFSAGSISFQALVHRGGNRVAFNAMTIPSVTDTDSETACMGVTKTIASVKRVPFNKASFLKATFGSTAKKPPDCKGKLRLIYLLLVGNLFFYLQKLF
jgi:hypothetical protein